MDIKSIIAKFKEYLHPVSKTLVLQYPADKNIKDIYVDMTKKPNGDGITSRTFYQLQSPEFCLPSNLDASGMRMTTIIDRKTNAPVTAYVARVAANEVGREDWAIMVKDPKGTQVIKNEKYKLVGRVYFFDDYNTKVCRPRKIVKETTRGKYKYTEEELLQYLKSTGNAEYAGIGVRLQQIRIERMFQNNMKNVWIVADGNSFPFNYSLGYRLPRETVRVDEACNFVKIFSNLNNKSEEENAKYLFVERENGKYVLNKSATLEHFFDDYYKNGGKVFKEFMPDMLLSQTAIRQWMAMIQRSPILY